MGVCSSNGGGNFQRETNGATKIMRRSFVLQLLFHGQSRRGISFLAFCDTATSTTHCHHSPNMIHVTEQDTPANKHTRTHTQASVNVHVVLHSALWTDGVPGVLTRSVH